LANEIYNYLRAIILKSRKVNSQFLRKRKRKVLRQILKRIMMRMKRMMMTRVKKVVFILFIIIKYINIIYNFVFIDFLYL
jgi:hypothetical protein